MVTAGAAGERLAAGDGCGDGRGGRGAAGSWGRLW